MQVVLLVSITAATGLDLPQVSPDA